MAGNYDIVIEQGATFSLAITVTGIDLTTYTARGQGRTTHASPDKAFTLSTAIAYSLPNSTITVSLTATQTTALTAPLSRYVAQNIATLPLPFRRYQTGSVFRNEKPGPGRFREFTQFDADTVGSASASADAELLMMLSDTLEALGLTVPALSPVWAGSTPGAGDFNDATLRITLTQPRAPDRNTGVTRPETGLNARRAESSP